MGQAASKWGYGKRRGIESGCEEYWEKTKHTLKIITDDPKTKSEPLPTETETLKRNTIKGRHTNHKKAYGMLQKALVDPGLDLSAKAVYGYIFEFRYPKCYETLRSMAKSLGTTVPTLRSRLAKLVETWYLIKEPRQRRSESDTYRVVTS